MIVKTFIPSAVVLLVASFCFEAAGTEMIDFETGFERLQPVTSVSTSNNTLNFSLSGGSTLFIANVGIPKDGFEAVTADGLSYDVPTGGDPGNFFSTYGPKNPSSYLFDFDMPVSEFSVQLYDFRGDGGAQPTDFVNLIAYSDQARTTQVDIDQFVVPVPPPVDGSVQTLQVSAPAIRALTLEFSTPDRGTGIDNISFVTVPEPTACVLLLIGLLPFIRISRRAGRFFGR